MEDIPGNAPARFPGDTRKRASMRRANLRSSYFFATARKKFCADGIELETPASHRKKEPAVNLHFKKRP
jgi:hypothetical protein